MKRQLKIYPNSILTKKAEQIINISTKTNQLIVDMFNILEQHNGLGLAAPQVGELQSVIVYKINNNEEYMINPVYLEIEDKDDEQFQLEQCLSFPGVQVRIPRLMKIKVGYQNIDKEEQILEAEGLLARIIQHEIDHLEGKTLIDYLSPVKKDILKRKINKLIKKQKKVSYETT